VKLKLSIEAHEFERYMAGNQTLSIQEARIVSFSISFIERIKVSPYTENFMVLHTFIGSKIFVKISSTHQSIRNIL
jgi:hypothetical protein